MNSVDLVIAVICFVSFVVGVPANVISLKYFLRKNYYNSTCIYIAVVILDILTCVMVLPVGRFVTSLYQVCSKFVASL